MKIGVLDSGYDSYELEQKFVKKFGYELEIFEDHFGSIDDKVEFSRDKTGLFIRQTLIDSAFLEQCPQLRAIVRYGIGYDNINLAEAKARHVKVANVQGYATYCVSDHAMALLFACLRSLPRGEEDIHKRFGKPPIQDIFELHDKTLGIIGLGRIGSRFALNCHPLFKKVLGVDPYISEVKFKKAGVIRTGLKELLTESHVISIHCNLTEETHHLINRETIAMMKNKPVIINTARGPVTDERDILWALNDKRIHSAGIDVWEDEPLTPKQRPLTDHPRVISTGHYAWYSDNSSRELQKKAAVNMIGLLQGKKVPDRLT
ncbi:MAG: C-terminal binding protein [Cyclobacteriaceae bacterium]|nr:C-terminal binding protein [Cyclobacteriaceae bacterium]